MKKINLIGWLSRNSHEKQTPQRFARYAATLILFLMCVTHAWATWYCPGTIGGTHWDNTNVMSGIPPTITFSNISPSWYEFQFKSGDSWSGNGCLNSISGLLHNKSTSGGNAGFNVSLTCDVVLKVTDTSNKKGTATGDWNSSTNYYVTGPSSFTGADWGATPSGGKFTDGKVTFSDVASGNHQFKLTDGANWSPDNVDYVTEISGTVSAHTTADNNMQITVTCRSNITFTQEANGGLSVHGEPVLYIAGNGTGTTWCAGQNWDEDYASCLLSKTATDKYSITFDDVDAGDYQFKITDGGWTNILNGSNFSNSSPSNVTLSSSGDPNYNICFTLTGTSDVTVLVDKSSGSALSGWKVYVTVKYSGLTVSAANTSSSPTISATTVNKGSGVTVTANAATGYEIDSWSSDYGSFANASAASTTFTPTSNDAEAVATYKEKTYSVTVATANSSYGKVMDDQTSTTVNAKHFTSDCEITATPEEGYRFAGWTKTGNVIIANAASASTTIKATSTGATVTATFEELPAGQLEVVAGAHGSVKIDGEDDWSTTSYTYTDQNDDVDLSIYAKADANYHFVNWTKVGDGSIKTNAATGKYTLPGRGSATVTANFAETTYAVTIGTDGVGTVGSTSPSGSTQVGAVTPVAVSAPAAKAGYKWGRWVTSANVTAASPTSASTSLTATGTGTATATYDEDLSTTFYVRGGGKFDNSWDSNTKPMTKKTGHSTESVAYFTVSIDEPVGESADTDYDFKIYNSANSTEYGLPADGAAYWWTRSTTTQSLNASGKPIQLRADIAGDYEIKVDYSGATPTVTVTFPTRYTVTYSVGTTKGQSDDPSAATTVGSVAISSGDYVLSGTSVTFTAVKEKDGYTYKGWYDGPTTANTRKTTELTYTTTISGNTTLYAVYTENSNTITVQDDGHCSVNPTSTTAGAETASEEIEATPDEGYYFYNWTCESGSATFSAATSSTTTVNATKNSTVQANVIPKWAVAGTMTTPTWSPDINLIENITSAGTPAKYSGYKEISLDPNTTYSFKIVDRKEDGWYGMPKGETYDLYYANRGTAYTLDTETGNENIVLHTAAAGTYRFTWNMTDEEVTITYPTSWYITIGQKTYYGDASSDATTTGGNVTAEDDDSHTITTGQAVADDADVVFTAHLETGYSLTGWYSDAACTEAYVAGTNVAIDNEAKTLTLSNIGDDVAVYAKFTENMTTVSLVANGNGKIQYWDGDSWEDADATITAGVATTRRLVPVADAGYYFAGWTKTAGTDYSISGTENNEDNAEITLTGGGAGETTGQTLTANFQPLDTIYFKNTLSWAKVFVYFNPSWDYAVTPSYSKGVHPIDAEYTEMTNIGDNIYRALIPRSFTRNNYTKVAFSDVDMHTYDNFHENNAVYRDDWDYNTKTLDMYIPCVNTNEGATHRGTNQLVFNGTTYYNHGYWVKKDVKINDGMGYYIKNSSSLDRQFVAIANDEYVGKVTVRVDNLSDQTYFICSAGGREYSNTGITFTDGGGDNQTLYIHNSRGYFTVRPSAEGDYTFYLYQDGDHMSINVSYPVSPGDYRIRHSYTDGGTKYSYSDIIKKGTTSDKVSMYIRNTSGTLMIAKCRDLDENKKPVWTTGIDVTGYTADNFPKAGVYVFDLALVDNNLADPTKELTSATISNAAPYTGDYYIKTDCADGGWVNYTQNVLDKNTINASDFDYYYCKNVRGGTNVKFVIANDYNIQVTDTIIQDLTYLTTSGGGTSKEYLPESSCIRFSYNSATNEAKRAYLRYSNNNNFLNIIPSAASTVYDAASAGNDLYNSGNANANNKFGNDDGNFVYRKTVYAVSGATIDVKAEYNSNTQTFVSGKTLITSNQASTRYPVRVVYDFKTNHLTMAWEASTGLTDKLSNTEFLYIRNGQNAAGEVSLGVGGAVAGSKVCGVFQFDYNDYVGKVGAWPEQAGQDAGYTYSKCMFYFSFPFDVNVSDIFGLGTYGKEWKLQYYDGAERAKKGFFRGDGTTTFWKDVPADSVLTKNVGYSLLLDNDYFNTTADGMVFEGKSAGGSVYLYFPSANAITLGQGATSIDVPSHKCTLSHSWTEGDKTLYHSNTDSHWNMMGVPLFQSQTGDYSATFKSVYDAENPFGYLYAWDPSENSLNIANASDFTFKSMNAYMVQYTGTVNFSGSNVASIVAAPQRKEEQNYTIDLAVLNSNDEHINRTYVELREGASDNFELNEDVYMTLNSKNVNIYSYAGDYDVAANVLSVANHTVPVGVTVKANGTYKFSMLSNFSGTVTLVDKFAQTRTNLAIEDYEVTLNKGTINDRFELEININKTPTAIDGVESGEGTLKDGKAHKFIMNDMLYIIRDGRIYDATGILVK